MIGAIKKFLCLLLFLFVFLYGKNCLAGTITYSSIGSQNISNVKFQYYGNSCSGNSYAILYSPGFVDLAYYYFNYNNQSSYKGYAGVVGTQYVLNTTIATGTLYTVEFTNYVPAGSAQWNTNGKNFGGSYLGTSNIGSYGNHAGVSPYQLIINWPAGCSNNPIFNLYLNNNLITGTSYDLLSNTISITQPIATSTALMDFNTWGTHITTTSTTTPLYSYIYFWNFLTPGTTIINKELLPNSGYDINFSQPKIGKLTDGNYQVQAFIKTTGLFPATLATSSIVDFKIDNVNGIKNFPDIPILDDTILLHLCDDVPASSGGFDDLRYGVECGSRKVMYWAIYPDSTMTSKVNDSFSEFKATFPFSAYYGLTDTVTESLNETATGTAGTLQMPFIDKHAHYYMLTVMSSSSLPNLIGGTNANLFRNSLSWFLWLAGAFVIFITFKKI